FGSRDVPTRAMRRRARKSRISGSIVGIRADLLRELKASTTMTAVIEVTGVLAHFEERCKVAVSCESHVRQNQHAPLDCKHRCSLLHCTDSLHASSRGTGTRTGIREPLFRGHTLRQLHRKREA